MKRVWIRVVAAMVAYAIIVAALFEIYSDAPTAVEWCGFALLVVALIVACRFVFRWVDARRVDGGPCRHG